jgi:zinc/manganese transport system permease protein
MTPSRRTRTTTTTTSFETLSSVLHAIVEPGFFSSSAVQLAAVLGGVVAIVAACVGVFTVIRGQSFAGEALGDIGAAGGSSAYLVGIGPVWGFVGLSLAASAVMELIGIQRARGRDLATGIVLGAGFGLAALFLYLGTLQGSTTGAIPTILFGSIFAISSSNLPVVLGLGALTIVTIVVLYRPLLLASTSPELAAARGVPVRLIGAAYLFAMAVAVALSALTIGAILSTALLVGPAAAALRLTSRPHRAILVAAAIGLACTWLGLLLAWDSYYWPHRGWPVSSFVVALVLLSYLLAEAWDRIRERRRSSR